MSNSLVLLSNLILSFKLSIIPIILFNIQNKVRLRVKQLRLENNKTQEEIAKYLDVDKSTYNKYENDKRKFNNDVVKQLADYYNIKISDIVD